MSRFGTIGPRSKSSTGVSYARGSRPVTVDDLPTLNLWSAHRGGGAAETVRAAPVAPDNTLAGWEYALSLGASILDMDCYPTLDSVYICMHDNTVDRTTDGTGAISTINYADLPQVDMRYTLGDGWLPEDIPTVEEFLDQFGHRAVLTVEPKNGTNGVTAVSAMVLDRGLERSVLFNCDISNLATVGAAVTAAGCLLHVYGLTTVQNITDADAAGAFLVEVPYNCDASLITALQAATNIKRWIAGPLQTRSQVDAMTLGLHGFVSNSPGYLDTGSRGTSIAAELQRQRIGVGWRYDDLATASEPALASDGIVTGFEGGNERSLLLGSLATAKPDSYTLTFSMVFGAWVGDTTVRTSIRACCTSDEGRNFDADTRGYTIRFRKDGVMELAVAPVGYGAATSLGSKATAAISDAGGNITLIFTVTATHVSLQRQGDSQVISVANTAWRGDYIWIGGTIFGTGAHPLRYTAVSIS